MEACLLDSLNKRVKFLEETFALLGLEGISAIHGRAEEYAKNKAYREKYDLCVSRAVSGLATLSEYCLPYVKVGGLFVSYKSGSVKEEAEAAEKAVKILGGKIRDIQYFDLPGSEIGRSLVIIEKVKNTPGKYPRKAGTPLREHWHKIPPVETKSKFVRQEILLSGSFTKLSQIYPTFITNYFYTIIR